MGPTLTNSGPINEACMQCILSHIGPMSMLWISEGLWLQPGA